MLESRCHQSTGAQNRVGLTDFQVDSPIRVMSALTSDDRLVLFNLTTMAKSLLLSAPYMKT